MENLELEAESRELLNKSESFAVANNEQLERITLVLKHVKGLQKKVKDAFDPIVEKANKAHKEATSQRKKYLEPLTLVEEKIKAAIALFYESEAKKAKEIEDKVNAELKARADEMKDKLLTEAADDEWLSEINKEKAAQIVPQTVDAKGLSEFKKQEGLSVRKIWKFKVTNASLVPTHYWMINEKILQEIATDTKDRHPDIPGIEFYQESSVAMRA